MGAELARRPPSRWQFEHERLLPTKSEALAEVFMKIAWPRRIASPSGPSGMALSGGGWNRAAWTFLSPSASPAPRAKTGPPAAPVAPAVLALLMLFQLLWQLGASAAAAPLTVVLADPRRNEA
jgi:hypothetical protein